MTDFNEKRHVTVKIDMTLKPHANLDLLMEILDTFARALEGGPCEDFKMEVGP